MEELSAWITRLKATKSRLELLSALDQFRVLEWTDEQRSSIAKLYMRLLDVLPDGDEQPAAVAGSSAKQPQLAAGSGQASAAASQQTAPVPAAGAPQTASEEDEEVWYEKM